MGLTTADWEREILAASGRTMRVVYTRAHSRVVWAQRGAPGTPGAGELRLATFFEHAPPEVRTALAAWLAGGARARAAARDLDPWIHEQLERLPPRAVRCLRTRGEVHDLATLARGLASLPCAALLPPATRFPALTWGRRTRGGARRVLRLGSCDRAGRVVRIHPVLDQPAVPSWFVSFVLYHELLHLRHPARPGRGQRMVHHGSEFRREEEFHPHCEQARAWERANIRGLLRSSRTGALLSVGAVAAGRPGLLARLHDAIFPQPQARPTAGRANG